MIRVQTGDFDIGKEIEALRLSSDDMPAADYQSALLEKMLELARVEDAAARRKAAFGHSSTTVYLAPSHAMLPLWGDFIFMVSFT